MSDSGHLPLRFDPVRDSRLPPAAVARSDGATLYCRHILWPLAGEEGRAFAEAWFGPEVIAGLPRDRYGNPRGFLHTYCRGEELRWASLSPRAGLGLDDCYRGTWQGKPDQPLLARARDLLDPPPQQHWQTGMAQRLGLDALAIRGIFGP